MTRYRTPKPTHGSAEWLAKRWKNEKGEAQISASVAGAVHGAHPYVSLADLATELLSATPPEPQKPNAAMDRGNRLEPTLIKWAGDNLNLRLVTPDHMYCYEEPGVRLIATVDAMSLAEPGYEQVVEVKTTNRRWQGILPDSWYWQGVQLAICTGVFSIDWVVFDSDLQLHHYVQKVSSDDKQVHIEACRQVLAQIDMGIYPDNVMYGFNHISARFPRGDDGLVKELTTDVVAQLRELDAIKQSRKQLDEQEDKIKAQICGALGDAEAGTVDGRLVCTWKNTTRIAFDQKLFEQEHPALYDKFKKKTTFRTFRAVNKGGN